MANIIDDVLAAVHRLTAPRPKPPVEEPVDPRLLAEFRDHMAHMRRVATKTWQQHERGFWKPTPDETGMIQAVAMEVDYPAGYIFHIHYETTTVALHPDEALDDLIVEAGCLRGSELLVPLKAMEPVRWSHLKIH